MRQAEKVWPPVPELNITVARVVDDWISFSVLRPQPLEWVYIFIEPRFQGGGHNLGCWTSRKGAVVWLLRNTRLFYPVPVTHWKPLTPDPDPRCR